MRIWELDRYDWDSLSASGSALEIPKALDKLSSAASVEDATTAYWEIDNCVVIQGTLFEAAVATAACAVMLLPVSSRFGRPRLIELLEQFTLDETAAMLRADVFNEIRKGFDIFAALLQHGSDLERSLCSDLLLYCATHDATLRQRAMYYIERATADEELSTPLRDEIAKRFAFERGRWL